MFEMRLAGEVGFYVKKTPRIMAAGSDTREPRLKELIVFALN